MQIKLNSSMRLVAFLLITSVAVFVRVAGLEYIEENLIAILPIVLTFTLLLPNKSVSMEYLKISLLISVFAVSSYIMFNGVNGIVFGLSAFWYFIFILGLESNNREGLFYKLNLGVLLLMVMFISVRVIYTGGDVRYFAANEYFPVVVVSMSSILAFLGIIISHLDSQERDRLSKEKDQSINWFSTLVNLVSHNLRSPLATILGNAQILEMKYPSVFKSHELERITNSVQTSNQIIDRLLKASFVTDQLSNHTLEESLANVYPELVIRGGLDELSYEQSVSIHLSLEVFLDNAFRFSPDQVELTMKGTRIEIRDYGQGLAPQQLESFGRLKGNTLGTLHGIGIPFALRILESIGFGVRAENCNPGLLIVIDKALEFQDAQLEPIIKPLSDKQIS